MNSKKYLISIFISLILLIIGYVLLYVSPENKVEKSTSTVTSAVYSCELSLTESDGWFCESDSDWKQRKQVHQIQNKLNRNSESISQFFSKNWEPTVHCAFAQRIGNVGDGGKWVCDPHKLQTNNTVPLIYSFGSNGDFSFEISIKQLIPNAEIHTFDLNVYQCPKNICTFHQVIIGDELNNATKSLYTVINELGHRERKIEILKIDVEGSEFITFKAFFQRPRNSINELPYIRQIQMEIHLPNGQGDEPARITSELFDMFRANNYVIFHKETNLFAPQTCFEYAFLRLNPRFF